MSQAPSLNRHRRGNDVLLVIMSVVVLVWGHVGTGMTPLPFALLVPPAYILMAVAIARSGLAAAGRRGYILSCLGGLCGVIHVAMTMVPQLGLMLKQQLTSGTDVADSLEMLLHLLSEGCKYFFTPIVWGVSLYVVSSVYEGDESQPEGWAAASRIDFEKLADWLEISDAPAAVRLLLDEWGEKVTALTAAYQELQVNAQAAGRAVQSSATAAGDLRGALAEVTTGGTKLATELRQLPSALANFREELAGANQESERLAAVVSQMHHVVDELSELMSHEILNLGQRAPQELEA